MVRHWRNFETAGFKDEVLENWMHWQMEDDDKTFSSENEIRDIIYETGQNDLYEIESLFSKNGVNPYYFGLIDGALTEYHNDSVDYDKIAASLWRDYVNEFPHVESWQKLMLARAEEVEE